MSVLWNELRVSIFLVIVFQNSPHFHRSAGRRLQKQAQGKGRGMTSISPEPPFTSLNNDLEIEDLWASSTVINSEVPLVEGRSHTPIPEDIGKGIAGGSSSKVADTAGGRVEHSQKSRKHIDDERSEDEDYQVSQEKGSKQPMSDQSPNLKTMVKVDPIYGKSLGLVVPCF